MHLLILTADFIFTCQNTGMIGLLPVCCNVLSVRSSVDVGFIDRNYPCRLESTHIYNDVPWAPVYFTGRNAYPTWDPLAPHNYYLYDFWNPEFQCRIHKNSPLIPILRRNNTIPRIDTCLFKVHSNIVLLSTPILPKSLFPVDLPVKIFKVLSTSSIVFT